MVKSGFIFQKTPQVFQIGLRCLDPNIRTDPPLIGQAFSLWGVFAVEIRNLQQNLRDHRRNMQLLRQSAQSLEMTEEAMAQMFAVPCVAGSRTDARPLLGSRAAASAPTPVQPRATSSPVSPRHSYRIAINTTAVLAQGQPVATICSWCTDDLLPGQATRLFPCHHALHESCAIDLFMHEAASYNWTRCPTCRYQLHPGDTGDDMAQRVMAQSQATAYMAQVPAATIGSVVLSIPPVPEGQQRSPEEVEEMALRAVSQASQLREHLATAQSLVDTSSATIARLKGRATRGLAH